MGRIFRLLVLFFLVIPTNVRAAASCEASYDPQVGWLVVPCVKIGTSNDVFYGGMESIGGDHFRLLWVSRLLLVDAHISNVQVLTDPFPIVLAYIPLSNGCESVYDPATTVIDGTNISIAVKVIEPGPTAFCPTNIRTVVKAFVFDQLGSPPGGTTYTVTVNGVAKSFFNAYRSPGM